MVDHRARAEALIGRNFGFVSPAANDLLRTILDILHRNPYKVGAPDVPGCGACHPSGNWSRRGARGAPLLTAHEPNP